MSRFIKKLLLILFFQNTFLFAQNKKKDVEKNYFLEVGPFQTNSIGNLNKSLIAINLPIFDSKMIQFNYGLSRIYKDKIYFSLSRKTLNINSKNTEYYTSFSSTGIISNIGYKFFDKKISIIPNIGFGIGTFSLSVSEPSLFSGTGNFNTTLFRKKISNTVSFPNFSGNASLLVSYKIHLKDKIEEMDGGRILTVNELPIGFSIGYNIGRDIGAWTSFQKLSNSPSVNFSGINFSFRVNTKTKYKKILPIK